MSDPAIVSVAEVEPVEMMPDVLRRTLATGERTMMVHVTLGRGSTVPRHRHPHEQVGYVVGGRIRMTIGEAAHELEMGQSYLIPSNVEHEATALTDCVVLDIFSPPREEYR